MSWLDAIRFRLSGEVTKDKEPRGWFVYILECSDKTLYTGITTDIEKRLAQHNDGNDGAKYTRVRRPVKCVYSESKKNRSEASKREYVIKKLTRAEKFKLIK